ncbi:MAG: C4-dicarboxylate ABC transporter [Peptococcaceae bacterium]|nr:C4-dicarboxylate ABC transporter [Peptococcaceae bacterium]
MQEKHVIKYLAPSWFAVIMGTGGLGNILYLWRDTIPAGVFLGTFLACLADILYFFVLIPWVMRWLFYYEYVRRDLHNPVAVNFFVTMPVATTIFGTNIYLIWSNYLTSSLVYFLCFLAYSIAIFGVTCFTFYTTFRMMRTEISPRPEAMNFSWIMAPIANMAVLLIGNPVLNMTIQFRPEWAVSVLVANISLFGIGFFLFIFISAIIFVRLAQYPLPPAEMTPSFGIFLSAVGLAVSAVIDTAKNAQTMGFLGSADFSYLSAACIWGFGIWIVGIIMIICIHQFRKGGIPFSLGWWAFIFPLAAYTIASQKIAAYFVTPLTSLYTLFLTALLAALWIYTFFNTLINALKGTLFLGVPVSDEKLT